MKTIDLYFCFERNGASEIFARDIAFVTAYIGEMRKNWKVLGKADAEAWFEGLEKFENVFRKAFFDAYKGHQEKFGVPVGDLEKSLGKVPDNRVRVQAFLHAGEKHAPDLFVAFTDEGSWEGGMQVGMALTAGRKVLFISFSGNVPEKVKEICEGLPDQAMLGCYDPNNDGGTGLGNSLINVGSQIVGHIDRAIEKFDIKPSDPASIAEDLDRIERECGGVLAGKIP